MDGKPFFQFEGNARWGLLGDPTLEYSGHGILLSGTGDGQASQVVELPEGPAGRWFRLSIRAMAQDGFEVEKDDLYLQVSFFKGDNPPDHIRERIYPQVREERKALKDEGTNDSLGDATWRWYSMEFRLPFPEIDRLQVAVGFDHGVSNGNAHEFWVNFMELKPVETPVAYSPRVRAEVRDIERDRLLPLGGRWYFMPEGEETKIPKRFDHTNAHQLLYLSAHFEAPFANNMSAWLMDGFKDRSGRLVKTPQFREDNVVIEVNETHLVVHTRNLPNHPTAFFPDVWRSLDGNPNYIQEQQSTYYIALEPKVNHERTAMTEGNANRALPMGPIGLAINGVIFFNPFDHIAEEDAVWRLDRCCGHPSPKDEYHYHKYPVCVKTPWTDDGEAHSPVIGFAFDGIPVYGPYESKGVMAKVSTQNPLNDFNVHHDKERGWHYHVTPGQFPHIIGGYWGVVDNRNLAGRGRGR